MRQTLSLPASYIPMAPPASMRETHRLAEDEVIEFMVGLNVDHFRMEGDYATFIQTHLMLPLTGVREGEETRAPVARGRGRATRSRRRGDPEMRQETGRLEFPTSLTYQRRYGEAYQIPIAPALAGHALVRIRGPISICTKPHILHIYFISIMLHRILIFSMHSQVPIEYIGQAIDLVAFLTEMIETSLDLLRLYRIPVSSFKLHFMPQSLFLTH